MPASIAHCAVCLTLFIHAASIVYEGAGPIWLVHVTGSLSVLNPAVCTALIRVWVGAGFPQLVSSGDASNEFPRFQPGAMSLAASCGVSRPVPPAPPAAEPPRPPVAEPPPEPAFDVPAAPDEPASAAPSSPPSRGVSELPVHAASGNASSAAASVNSHESGARAMKRSISLFTEDRADESKRRSCPHWQPTRLSSIARSSIHIVNGPVSVSV